MLTVYYTNKLLFRKKAIKSGILINIYICICKYICLYTICLIDKMYFLLTQKFCLTFENVKMSK